MGAPRLGLYTLNRVRANTVPTDTILVPASWGLQAGQAGTITVAWQMCVCIKCAHQLETLARSTFM